MSAFSPTLKFRMLPRPGSATNTTVSASTPQKSLIAKPASSMCRRVDRQALFRLS